MIALNLTKSPSMCSLQGSGPLIQVFFPRKVFTDKWSTLKFLWDVISDWVTCKIWSILHLDFADNELKHGLGQVQGNLDNFSTVFDYITPLCVITSLSSVYFGKHIPIMQGSLAQNFNGHYMEIWKCHGGTVEVGNFYKELGAGSSLIYCVSQWYI